MFEGLGGRLLDAVPALRTRAFNPPEVIVSGIETPAMLARARRRCPVVSAAGRLYRIDVAELEFLTVSFYAAVATFLFCVLLLGCRCPRSGSLVEWSNRVGRSGFWNMCGLNARCAWMSRLWQPWIAWAYGRALYDTPKAVSLPGLDPIGSRTSSKI